MLERIRQNMTPLETAAAFLFAFFIAFAVAPNSWWGPDDGAYAYVAKRLLEGDVLHRDIQDIHGGYVNFANALALYLFGEDILSLRWPLVLFAALQTGIVYYFARRQFGRRPAMIAGLSIGVMSYALNPTSTANWFTLIFAISIAALLSVDVNRKRETMRFIAIGFCVGFVFLLRQPTGVFVAFASLSVLFWQKSAASPQRDAANRAGTFLLGFCWLILAAYILKAFQPVGTLLFGLPALACLAQFVVCVDVNTKTVWHVLSRLALGVLVSAAPLVVYHLIHGSISIWLYDIVLAPLFMRDLAFFETMSYAFYPMASLLQTGEIGLRGAVMVFFWLTLFAMPWILSTRVIYLLRRGEFQSRYAWLVIAIFYALVAAHYEIAIYLFYTVGLSTAALSIAFDGRQRWIAVAAAGFCVGVAALFHIGQPAIRTVQDMAIGRHINVEYLGLDRASVKSFAREQAHYSAILAVTDACSAADAPIFALPTQSEIYFLTGRQSATRFFSTGIGMTNHAQRDAVANRLEETKTPLIFFNPASKYNTDLTVSLMVGLASSYSKLGSSDGIEVFARRPVSASCRDSAGRNLKGDDHER